MFPGFFAGPVPRLENEGAQLRTHLESNDYIRRIADSQVCVTVIMAEEI